MPVPNCPICSNPHSPDVECRYLSALNDRFIGALKASVQQHEQDSDCTVDPETLMCTICLVDHSIECPDCAGHGFHKPYCPVMREMQ